jgi:hypothetical protein
VTPADGVLGLSWSQLLVWLGAAFDGPFAVLLLLLSALGLMLWKAQKSGKLDLSAMFKDDAGKESGLRFAILGSWIFSSWALMSMAVSKHGDLVMAMGLYLLFWSGAPIAAKILEKWEPPWKKGPP